MFQIELLKNKTSELNGTCASINAEINMYLYETPRKLQKLRSLQEFMEELHKTQDRLMDQKYFLVKKKAEHEAQKENVALRAKSILLERKIKTLELRLIRRDARLRGDDGLDFAGQWKAVNGPEDESFNEEGVDGDCEADDADLGGLS
mmetsp:Transcript_4707/g.6669  ORF Transcript_4707/g.6669 Transcript_4707/m.6669 type:complete len:148 (+) Transcript_4707:6-449(+)